MKKERLERATEEDKNKLVNALDPREEEAIEIIWIKVKEEESSSAPNQGQRFRV